MLVSFSNLKRFATLIKLRRGSDQVIDCFFETQKSRREFFSQFFLVQVLALHIGNPVYAAATTDYETSSGEEITVLGTRLSTTKNQEPERIDREQIEQSAALTIVDLLRQLPGITSSEPGGAGGISELFVRGADPNFTTVFIDGVQTNDPTDSRGGAFDFSSIQPEEIERIEIVRGPFSALYGTGALAGAINLVTKTPSGKTGLGTAHLAVGTDGYWNAGIGVRGGSETVTARVSANQVDFGEPTKKSARTNSSFGMNVDANFDRNVTGTLTFRAVDWARSGYPVASGGPRLAIDEIIEIAAGNDYSFGATLSWKAKKFLSTAQVTYYDRENMSQTPAIPEGVFSGTPEGTTNGSFERLQVMFHSRVDLAEDVEFGFGYEYQHEQGITDGELDFGFFQAPIKFSASRITTSPFIEGRVQITSSMTALAALRYDDYSDGESTLSPRIGAEYQSLRTGMSLRASWGEARKKPSFYALGNPLIGNPDLLAEDSSGYDLELNIPIASAGLILSATAFNYSYSNLIDFDFATFSLVNRSNVSIDGVEVQIENTPGQRLQWTAFVATQKNVVDEQKDALLHRPEFSGGVVIHWRINSLWNYTMAVSHYGKRQSKSIPGGEAELAPYTRVNTTIIRSLSEKLDLVFSIDNLFDQNYESVAGFDSPGRQLRAGFRLNL